MTRVSLYTSDRERRLWFWALAVVVAIYSTLGLAGTLAEVLREHNLMRASFDVFSNALAALIGIVASLTIAWVNVALARKY